MAYHLLVRPSYTAVQELEAYRPVLGDAAYTLAIDGRPRARQRDGMFPSERQAFLWNYLRLAGHTVAAGREIARAHLELKQPYGPMSEAMAVCGSFRELLLVGVEFMWTHSGAPSWVLEEPDELEGNKETRFVRVWCNATTRWDAEATMALSEAEEWLAEVERHLGVRVIPKRVVMRQCWYGALRADERRYVQEWFGCPFEGGEDTALVFDPIDLDKPLPHPDPERLTWLRARTWNRSRHQTIEIARTHALKRASRELKIRPETISRRLIVAGGTNLIYQADDLRKALNFLCKGDTAAQVARYLDMDPSQLSRWIRRYSGYLPSSFDPRTLPTARR